jgi:hypothetical protein
MPLPFFQLWHDVTCDQSTLATRKAGADGPGGRKMAADRRPASTIVEGLQAVSRTACGETLKK